MKPAIDSSLPEIYKTPEEVKEFCHELYRIMSSLERSMLPLPLQSDLFNLFEKIMWTPQDISKRLRKKLKQGAREIGKHASFENWVEDTFEFFIRKGETFSGFLHWVLQATDNYYYEIRYFIICFFAKSSSCFKYKFELDERKRILIRKLEEIANY